MRRVYCLFEGTKRLLMIGRKVSIVDLERLKSAHNAALAAYVCKLCGGIIKRGKDGVCASCHASEQPQEWTLRVEGDRLYFGTGYWDIGETNARTLEATINAALAAERTRLGQAFDDMVKDYEVKLAAGREKADNLFKVARKHSVENNRMRIVLHKRWQLLMRVRASRKQLREQLAAERERTRN